MVGQLRRSTIATAVVAAAVGATISMLLMRSGMAGDASPSKSRDGKPDLSGVWQALNEAHWDLEAHDSRPGAVTQPGYIPAEYARVPAAPVLALGSAGGVPASLGVVEGDGRIPYTPEAAGIKKENAEHWIDRDPELKCYIPGIPRAMYMPYPFQIVQGTNKIEMAFAFSATARTIHLDRVDDPGGQYAGRQRLTLQRRHLVRPRGQFPQRRPAPGGALHAHLRRRAQVRGHHRGSQGVHATVEDLHAAVSPPRAQRAAPRIPVHRLR
jgi:hypothetical protein